MSGAVRVVCFDLDGTLTPTTVSQHLADRLGDGPRLRRLEADYAAGRIPNGVLPEETAGTFAGLTVAEVARLLADLPLHDGIAETVAALRKRGVRVLLGTVGWEFAARGLAGRLGFEAVCGTRMGEAGGRLDGRVARHCTPWDKARFVVRRCAAEGVPLAQCAAVGDARSDLPLFRRVGRAIAVNGTPAARAAAGVAVDTTDVRAVLPYLLGTGA